MEELGLAGALPAEADVAPAGLVVPGVGHGGDLLVPLHGGDLDLNVVGPGHGGGAVPGGQLHGAEVEAQALHQVLCLGDQLVEGGVGVLRAGELEHLYLIKLVSANHAPFLSPGRAGLPAEAGGVGKELLGQVCLGQDLVPVYAGQSGLGGGEHIVGAVVGGVLNLVDLVGKLGELTGGFAALVLQHVRRQDELIAVGQVGVDEVVQQGPLQPGTHAGVHPEAGSGQLHPPGVVNEAQAGAQVHMMLGLKVKLVGLAEVAQGLVVLLAAGLQVVVGQVGQGEHQGAVLCLHGAQLLVAGGNLRLQLAHALEHRGGVLSGLLQLGDGLGDLVLLRLHLLGGKDDVPAGLVQLQDAVHLSVAVHFLGPETSLDFVRVFLDAFDIQHGVSPHT